MFQTWLDLNKQIIRKAIDSLSGLAGGWLLAQGEWGAALVPVVIVAFNALWFWIDNRNKVTVAGLEAAGKVAASVDVEAAIKTAAKAVKKAGKERSGP